ncbi:hypothetical protein AN640_04205 [Candidatus Epulonipiscium fishelsonii]|uniref:Uncharacterized protein n=1 Tax=Candidatus Epulonipiscium fishelsonii TaxID=77094 RepID=A0ACC8XJ24_9FIRM|nr:hypothetical protein AN640_04205 [Epulopiscium sp. SCG-D08WGA-EpuloA1]
MEKTGMDSSLNLKKLPIIESRGISIAKMCKGKSVLTIGCVDMIETIKNYRSTVNSERFQLYNLNKYCKEVIGIDVNKEGIDRLIKYGYKNVYKYDIFVDQLDEIDKKEYDVIILSHVIEHVPDMYNFLKIIIQKFKFKKIIIAVPNAYDFFLTMRILFKNTEVISNDHYYTFSPITLKKLLESLSLKTEAIYIDRSKNLKFVKGQKNLIKEYIHYIIVKLLYKNFNYLGNIVYVGTYKPQINNN